MFCLYHLCRDPELSWQRKSCPVTKGPSRCNVLNAAAALSLLYVNIHLLRKCTSQTRALSSNLRRFESLSLSLSLPVNVSAMAVNSGDECQDAYGVAVLPGVNPTKQQCESQLDILSLSEVPNSNKSHMYLDAQSNHEKHINLKMENVDLFTPHILDMDIEKGKLEIPKSNDETIGNLKTEDPLTHWQRTLQRQLGLQIGGKFMQLLMNDSLVLPKFISRDKSGTERVHDTLNNRSRKYKRSASFNSRKVVLLFSVLSSMGTIILIYLTLRVRQMGDGYAHV